MTIRLVLPHPVSSNRYWRSFVPRGTQRAITAPSKEAELYKRDVRRACQAAGIEEPITGRVRIEVLLYPHRPLDAAKRIARDPLNWDDTVQCIDLDNANKVLLDALKGRAIVDDKWVYELRSRRMEPDGEARVVVTIEPIVREVVQPQLFTATARAPDQQLHARGLGVPAF